MTCIAFSVERGVWSAPGSGVLATGSHDATVLVWRWCGKQRRVVGPLSGQQESEYGSTQSCVCMHTHTHTVYFSLSLSHVYVYICTHTHTHTLIPPPPLPTQVKLCPVQSLPRPSSQAMRIQWYVWTSVPALGWWSVELNVSQHRRAVCVPRAVCVYYCIG